MHESGLPLITCITMTYRKFDYLFETINSILVQDYQKIELIIADDGSESFPEEDVINYINKNKHDNIERITIINHKDNMGTVRNFNSAIRQSMGEYIFPVSCGDVLYNKNVISKAVERLIETGWDLISFRRQFCTEKELKPIRMMPDEEKLDEVNNYNTPFKQFKAFAGFNSFNEMASGSAICYKKSLLEKYGLFDEDYRLWEDGPFLVKYTREGNLIHTAFDIVYIKYRFGGVSSNNKKNSPTSVLLKKDKAKMLEKDVIPYYKDFSAKEKRILNCEYYCCKHYYSNKVFLGMNILLRWPDLFFQRYFKYRLTGKKH